MDLSNYRCVRCSRNEWRICAQFWTCKHCGHQYSCVRGIPRLYLEGALGEQDKALRDRLYNGMVGKYYRHLMPLLSLPARPLLPSWKEWLTYVAGAVATIGVAVRLMVSLAAFRSHAWSATDSANLAAAIALAWFFLRNPQFFALLILAVPVKLSSLRTPFAPTDSFSAVHTRLLADLQRRNEKLKVLDVATGTGNSLYRHGWMKLKADYVGLDLSETMILQALDFMEEHHVCMEFVLGDAADLPFQSETFDVVLNYGAINGTTNPGRALEEMARVAKRGGIILFFDEQLYEAASLTEKLYFRWVLSSHDVVHACPVHVIPPALEQVIVRQIFRFYYLCTCVRGPTGDAREAGASPRLPSADSA